MISYGPNFFFPDAYARDQYSPAEERRQAAEELRQELEAEWREENAWLEEIAPDEKDAA